MGRWVQFLIGLCLATSALVTATAQSREQVSLSPSEPWRVHYADDSCLMARNFGPLDNSIGVRFEQTAPGRQFSMTLFGKSLKANEPFPKAATTFLPVGKRDARDHVASGTTTESKLPLLVFESLFLLGPAHNAQVTSDYDWNQVNAINALLIEFRGDAYLLNLGRMDKVLAAMDKCTDELLTHWGLDAVAQRTMRQGPAPRSKPGTWLRSEDYPKDALAKGSNAIVRFRLTIDATGKVVGCAIPSATFGPAFAKSTCDGLSRRARFDPAIDKDGKPIASYFVSAVNWVIY